MVAFIYTHRVVDTETRVFPPTHVAHGLVVNLEGVQKQAENTFPPEIFGVMLPDIGYGNKMP